MPMYDFACRECEQVFEKRLRMSQASDPQTCPGCGSSDTRRHMSASFAVGGGSSLSRTVSAPPPSSPFT